MDDMTALVVVAWLVGGFVSGVSGIGGAMVAVPLAALFLPMRDVVALSCILNVFMDGTIACLHWRHARPSALVPMLAGTVPGSGIGLSILAFIPGTVLQGTVGVLLFLFTGWQYSGRVRRARGESRTIGALAGFCAGVLGTAISFDGPPAGAYGLYAGWPPRVFLGTLGVFFVIRGLLTCGLQAAAGFYTPDVLHYAAHGIPAVMAGTLLSFPVIRHIRGDAFRRVLMLVIGLAALVCLGRAVV